MSRSILAILALLPTFACAPEGTDAQASGAAPRPSEAASEGFWDHWSDGKAELCGYRGVTPRYGQLRDAEVVLIFVTEEMDVETLIKDDTGRVPADRKEVVLKLNHTLKFRTGIYPYSVMTSVFSPVGSAGRERFAPVKISFTAQEWCGQVFQMLKPTVDGFDSSIRSYFSVEGDVDRHVETAPFAIYEDALFIQLRELDGPFEGGGDWSGQLVPALWHRRIAHLPLVPVAATITRAEADRDGTPVTAFTLRHEWTDRRGATHEIWRRFDVERDMPHRVLGWESSTGERFTLTGSTRLSYWQLNANGQESYLTELGLDAETRAPR